MVLRGGEEIPFASLGPPLRGYQTIPAPAVQVCGLLSLPRPRALPHSIPCQALVVAAVAAAAKRRDRVAAAGSRCS